MYSYYPDHGHVIRDSDKKQVAPCQSTEDQDFKDYIAWIYEGNTPSDPPPPETLLDLEQVKTNIINAIQNRLDETAKTRGYDGILSLCTYATSNIPQFKLEGQAGVDWRDACWSYCYQLMSDIQSGKRPLPSVEAVMTELPSVNW